MSISSHPTASETAAVPDPLVALMKSVAAGDRDAFAELYRATASRMLGLAVRMLGRRELAEEVLQEAFLAVWQKASSYRPELGAPIAWITTIVRHRAIDRLRLIGGSLETAAGSLDELESVLGEASGKSESGIVIQKTIQDCLEGLKDNQRKFILLAFYYGYTHEELSSQTGTPLGTVKSGVRRGLADLRACLEQ